MRLRTIWPIHSVNKLAKMTGHFQAIPLHAFSLSGFGSALISLRGPKIRFWGLKNPDEQSIQIGFAEHWRSVSRLSQ